MIPFLKHTRLIVLLAAGFLASGLVASPVLADATHGTKEEAQALSEKAAALIKAEGPEKAFPTIQAKDGGFIDRDLYVFISTARANMSCMAPSRFSAGQGLHGSERHGLGRLQMARSDR